MGFIQWWKDRCTAMLNATPFTRRKMNKEIEILDDEMQSRWDKLHGPDGLCHAVVQLFDAMAELRMKAQYGDYLAYTCAALRTENMNDLAWKVDRQDWQGVAQQIEKEESTIADYKIRRLAPPPTPYLDDIAKAADRLGYDVGIVRYQILAYAARNNFCHSGLKGMINKANFLTLAERIVEDKRALGAIFRGRPHEQIEIRLVIKIVEKEWFDKIVVDEKGPERVKYILTEKATEKARKVLQG